MALNIKWSDRVSNVDVFGTIPKPRHDDILAHHVLFWEPRHGRRGPGRPRLTFLNPGHAKGGRVHQGPSYAAARKSSLLCSNDKCGGGTQQLEPMNRPKSVHYNNLLPVDWLSKSVHWQSVIIVLSVSQYILKLYFSPFSSTVWQIWLLLSCSASSKTWVHLVFLTKFV